MTIKKITLKLSQKALILVAVPLIFEIGFVVTLYSMLRQADEQVQKGIKAKAILHCFNHLNFCMGNAMRHLVTLRAMGGGEAYQGYIQAISELGPEFTRLRELLKDDPRRLKRIVDLEEVVNVCEVRLQNVLDSADPAESFQAMQKLRPILAKFTRDINEVRKDSEQTEQLQPKLQLEERNRLKNVLAAGVGFNILLAIFLVVSFNRSTTKRLSVLMDNTKKLAAGLPLNPPLEGDDEMAHLDQVFSEMVEAISEAAEKEQAVVKYAQEVICSLDENGSFSKVNPASLKVWGFDPNDLIGTPVFNIILEEDRQLTTDAINALKFKNPSMTFENRIQARNGTLVDTLWSARWSEIDRSIFCVANNITDRKQVERLRQDFYSMVTHDLRTPLGSVYGMLGLVCAKAFGPLSEPVEAKLKIAQVNIERLIALINDLLDLDKLEAGKMPLELATIETNSIVDRSIMAVENYAQQQEIKLEKTGVQTFVHADADRLIQVLVNLIANSIKFSPKGSTVTIGSNESDDMVEFTVQDRGRGIPEAYQKAIFERFQQVQASDARRNVGTGLGLSVCKLIVENHGGQIGVHSEEGKGSTFWFKIPKKSS